MKKKLLVYQFKFEVKLDSEGKLSVEDSTSDKLKVLALGKEVLPILQRYSKRKEFVWADTVIGVSDIYPVIDLKVELESFTKDSSSYVLEVSCSPDKLCQEDRDQIEKILTEELKNDSVLYWWDSGDGSLPKKPRKNKEKVLKEVKSVAKYSGEDDQEASEAEATIEDALEFFKFQHDVAPEEVAAAFKDRLRELQRSLHPDRNGGQEEPYKEIQKYREIVEEWLELSLE